MALRVCPRTQISIDKKVVTIPTAARDSVAFSVILPIMAASVSERIGSETPAIKAGIANLFMLLNEISVLNRLIHNDERDTHFV